MKAVYTIDDLASRDLLDAGANKPARLAVIGCPIKHSASPQMHQAALDQEGLDMRYIRIEVQPEQVKCAFSRMMDLGFLGCNVTVPHKLEAMDVCDELTDDAKALGAVNTVIFNDGKALGHNTDGPGLAAAINEDFGRPLSDFHILLLGAGGGAGHAIATQCVREGCQSIQLSNRTVSKVEDLATELTQRYGHTAVSALSNDDNELCAAAAKATLIINSTSLGLKEDDALPLPKSALLSGHHVYDAIYNPARTPLLLAAEASGAKVANGLSMLLHQGALAFEQWTAVKPNIETMRKDLAIKA